MVTGSEVPGLGEAMADDVQTRPCLFDGLQMANFHREKDGAPLCNYIMIEQFLYYGYTHLVQLLQLSDPIFSEFCFGDEGNAC
jgi:hypothetical protein